MRLSSCRFLLVCFALFAVWGQAGAAEYRHGTLENTPAAEPASTPPTDRLDDVDLDGAAAAVRAQRAANKPKAPATTRATGDNRALPSRFHSFLPGMFR